MLFFRAASRPPPEVSTKRRRLRDSVGVVLDNLDGPELVDAFPCYLPRRSRPVLSFRGVCEVCAWSLAVALRRAP